MKENPTLQDIHGAPLQDWPTHLVAFWAGYYLGRTKKVGRKVVKANADRHAQCYAELLARKLAAP